MDTFLPPWIYYVDKTFYKSFLDQKHHPLVDILGEKSLKIRS